MTIVHWITSYFIKIFIQPTKRFHYSQITWLRKSCHGLIHLKRHFFYFIVQQQTADWKWNRMAMLFPIKSVIIKIKFLGCIKINLKDIVDKVCRCVDGDDGSYLYGLEWMRNEEKSHEKNKSIVMTTMQQRSRLYALTITFGLNRKLLIPNSVNMCSPQTSKQI